MKIIIDLVLILVPFLYTYWLRDTADAAKKLINVVKDPWTKITNRKINWVYVWTIFSSTFISTCGVKAFSRDIFNCSSDDWEIWALIAFLINVIIAVANTHEPYEEDLPPLD